MAMVFCAACGFDRPLGGYKASLLRDEKNVVVGFKSGWICVYCVAGNVSVIGLESKLFS
jgi:hypothetical protein